MAGELHLNRGVGLPVKCRACGVSIAFAYTTGGKLAPFHQDAEGRFVLRNGNVFGYEAPTTQLELGAAPVAPPQRYTSHFATCPAAADFRKDRRGGS